MIDWPDQVMGELVGSVVRWIDLDMQTEPIQLVQVFEKVEIDIEEINYFYLNHDSPILNSLMYYEQDNELHPCSA